MNEEQETVKVKFKECVAGLTFCYYPSNAHHTRVYDLPKQAAEGYITRGIAELVEEEHILSKVEKPKRRKSVRKSKKSQQNINTNKPTE